MKNKKLLKSVSLLLGAGLFAGLSGCATTSEFADERDPLEGFNRNVYLFNDKLDKYALKPIAEGYQWVMPEFADKGVSHFFSNLGDLGITLNDLLQFKLGQAGEDGSRFLINTTLGIAGFMDVATGFGFEKHNEDFGQTLGVWGVPAGPYIVLPFFGPSSPRGATGLVGDYLADPITYVTGWDARLAFQATRVVDFRADNLSTSKVIGEAALDEYEFIRDGYFQRREYLVFDGNPPEDEEEFFEEEEF
jgi:phospholipid-binding lipoprotein MlaA